MKNNQKFLSGFLLGAAAGAAITVFLRGEKGKTLVRSVKSNIQDAAGDLKINGTLEKWVNKGRTLLDEFRNRNVEEHLYDLEEIFS